MSKSLGNYIGIDESPAEMFGKLMSISDTLMWRYFELLSFKPMAEISRLHSSVDQGYNPRDAKMLLADEIVTRFHGQQAAGRAQEEFINRFRHGQLPENMQEIEVVAKDGGYPIGYLLKDAGLTGGTAEAFRMIDQGAVRIDGEKVVDRELRLPPGKTHVVQVGKRRFARVTVK